MRLCQMEIGCTIPHISVWFLPTQPVLDLLRHQFAEDAAMAGTFHPDIKAELDTD